MSIDKDLLDRLMEGGAPGDLFGKGGVLSELTKLRASINSACSSDFL
jgi:putative transposase